MSSDLTPSYILPFPNSVLWNCFIIAMFFAFCLSPPIYEIMQYFTFCVWFILLFIWLRCSSGILICGKQQDHFIFKGWIIFHRFFIYLSTNRHLDYFHILATVNICTKYERSDIFMRWQFHFLWLCAQRRDCCLTWIFNFFRTLHLFSIMAVSIYSLTNSVWGFPFSLHFCQCLLSLDFFW